MKKKAKKAKKTNRAAKKPVTRKVVASAAVIAQPKTKKLRGEALKYQRMLLALRDHLLDAINTTAGQSLNRSQRDSSGDISGYPTHQADAGADDFDREFALSLVSSEQEGLYEIEEALQRLEVNTFGRCEMCEKIIAKARLRAVPFARFCLVCQSQVEQENKNRPRAALSMEESAEEDGEEAEETTAE